MSSGTNNSSTGSTVSDVTSADISETRTRRGRDSANAGSTTTQTVSADKTKSTDTSAAK
ncbi:hypothetical protein EXIGLDRAFT_313288 [Exidia glandulosa HHB12029]|uniref:Uncharacterized protein n=1 Tax=Exidia glandulosa HHB12029 TaxID=1314781 RepID=A0A165LTF2_EXIGL|nr:hypothetical protein EXIGLDRAFT_313288 [Exidia glandulosa HHB12029]